MDCDAVHLSQDGQVFLCPSQKGVGVEPEAARSRIVVSEEMNLLMTGVRQA